MQLPSSTRNAADYRAVAQQLAQKYGLPFFPVQIQQESNYDPSAVSSAGAQGIAQIMPATAQGWGVDATDPLASLQAAAEHMRAYMDKYNNDPRMALAAYNMGEGNLAKYGPTGLSETANYIQKILGSGAQLAEPQTTTAPSVLPSSFQAQTPLGLPSSSFQSSQPLSDPYSTDNILQSIIAGRGLPNPLETLATGYQTQTPDLPLPGLSQPRVAPLDLSGLLAQVSGGEAASGSRAPTTAPPTTAPAAPARTGKGMVSPISLAISGGSEFATVDAEGAPDSNGVRHHAAKDYFAPGGSPVSAPEAGVVVEAKPSRGNSGQVFGGTVKIQLPDKRVWVFRHVDPNVKVGQKVAPGAPIASVTKWADNPKSSHSHIELWKTLQGGYNYENMLDPYPFLTGGKPA